MGGVDVHKELFQFLSRLENAVLRHVLDRLDGPDALALHLLIEGLETGSGDPPAQPALLVVISPPYETHRCKR
jgi:hypothetical protein